MIYLQELVSVTSINQHVHCDQRIVH